MKSTLVFMAVVLSWAMFGMARGDVAGQPQAQAAAPGDVVQAVCEIESTKGNTAKGTVRFTQTGNTVAIVADIAGLTEGKHGFHIHEGTECGEDGMKAGGHYNPEGHQHAGPGAAAHHAGDFGNLVADKDGKAHLDLTVDDITINGAKNPVAGRAMIVHAKEDDLASQPAGNAGPRVGCGIIKVVEKK